MSVGFRKSFLGFNCDDVIEYIQNSHKKFSEKENELNQKIDSLDNTIAHINTQLEEVKSAKAVVEAQLKDGDQMYYARVMKTDVLSDIACWKTDWVQPFTKTYDAIPGMEGIVRRATVDGVQYTNVLWYDKDTGCTYSLDWQGGGEIPSWPAWIFNKMECPQVSIG